METLSAEKLAPELQEVNLQDEKLPASAHKTLGLVWQVSKDQIRIEACSPIRGN